MYTKSGRRSFFYISPEPEHIVISFDKYGIKQGNESPAKFMKNNIKIPCSSELTSLLQGILSLKQNAPDSLTYRHQSSVLHMTSMPKPGVSGNSCLHHLRPSPNSATHRRNCSPYFSNLNSPTPDTDSISFLSAGRITHIWIRDLSEKTI